MVFAITDGYTGWLDYYQWLSRLLDYYQWLYSTVGLLMAITSDINPIPGGLSLNPYKQYAMFLKSMTYRCVLKMITNFFFDYSSFRSQKERGILDDGTKNLMIPIETMFLFNFAPISWSRCTACLLPCALSGIVHILCTTNSLPHWWWFWILLQNFHWCGYPTSSTALNPTGRCRQAGGEPIHLTKLSK